LRLCNAAHSSFNESHLSVSEQRLILGQLQSLTEFLVIWLDLFLIFGCSITVPYAIRDLFELKDTLLKHLSLLMIRESHLYVLLVNDY
jgi:hypothetical protein